MIVILAQRVGEKLDIECLPATAVVTYFARTLTPSSSALLRRMSTTAAAPSVTWLALPPVVVPLPH